MCSSDLEVESHNGNGQFETLTSVAAQNVDHSSYSWTHRNPAGAVQYYRIKAVEQSGEVKYSSVVTVRREPGISSVQVYPNPAVDHKISLNFQNMERGVYKVILITLQGNTVMKENVTHGGGSTRFSLQLPKEIAAGYYILQVGIDEKVLLREKVQVQH